MTRLIALLSLLATPALADGFINGVPVDCYCTDRQGQRIELGETICMQVDGRMFMAQCQMSLNVPMWREIAPGCLSSGFSPRQSFPHAGDPAVNPLSVDTEILATKS